MEIFKAIDLISQNRIVRWALMVTIVAITVLYVYLRIQYFALDMECRELKVRASEYETSIDRQNQAIRQAADEYEVMVKNFDGAVKKSKDLEKQLAKRKVEIREVVLQGSCDQMVQQVVQEVRK